MTSHTTTRVPVNDDYATLLGKAIYIFAYYEWGIIYIIENFNHGFVHTYSREKTMTSGVVKSELKRVISDVNTDFSKITQEELRKCFVQFNELIDKRNALIHAHPCADTDGAQILSYQTMPHREIPDMTRTVDKITAVISEFDQAACDANQLLDKIR